MPDICRGCVDICVDVCRVDAAYSDHEPADMRQFSLHLNLLHPVLGVWYLVGTNVYVIR